MNKKQAIANYFNVPIDAIKNLPPETIAKMEKAYDKDDMMALHHLGYELTEAKSTAIVNTVQATFYLMA